MPRQSLQKIARLRGKPDHHSSPIACGSSRRRPPSNKALPADSRQYKKDLTTSRRSQRLTARREHDRSPDQEPPFPKYEDAAAAEWHLPLDRQEDGDGPLIVLHKDFDPANKLASHHLVKSVIAWPRESIKPQPVNNGSYQYALLGVSGPARSFMWGMIKLHANQSKRPKSTRQMHIVFTVIKGAVKVKVHEYEFTVHEGGMWQVPPGNTYSVQNVSGDEVCISYAQSRLTSAELTGLSSVSTLLMTSLAPFLALLMTDYQADMPTASDLRGRSARLLTGMLAVSTLFSLRRVLFLVLAVIESVDVIVPLHLQEEFAKEEAQLAPGTPSGQ
ncbi:hypothetical protein E8E12_000836 [Didymella heteroderae]|uniref:Mif2/CENP-C cupin domain-containing protein n=1 Tax=Didymella heteroderae TaxID=1769908 RepID=A0A9P4WHL5_9PLEO|nr:hypothetical protein E8E12_000836 [Didymella heteroderae]